MLELFLPVPFHAFFGVAIMMAGSLVVDTFAEPPAGWGVDPLADQGVAGGIVWAFGELPTVLVLAVVFFSWAGSDERRGRAIDRAADRNGDAELEAYNARLEPWPTRLTTPRPRRPDAADRASRRGRPRGRPRTIRRLIIDRRLSRRGRRASAGRSSLVALISTAGDEGPEHAAGRRPR